MTEHIDGAEDAVTEPGAESEVAQPAAPRSARGAVLVGARILTGTIGVVIGVAVVAAAGWLPLPSIAVTPSATTVTPVPTDQQRVCAGPILRLGSDTGEGATTASSIGTPRVEYAANEGAPTANQLESTDSTTGVTPVRITLPPTHSPGSRLPLLSASQTQTVDRADVVGLAAAECREASGDAWLVGGATTTGRTSILTMSNPGQVIATVDVTIYTESGEVTAAGTDGIVVPPGGQRVLSLAGFAPGAAAPVVRVQSRGSLVVANLQQSIVRTLEPGGVDVIGAVAGPTKTTVIPGIVLADPESIAARANAPGYDDLGSVLRAFVPGKEDAHVKLTITRETPAGAAAGSAAPKPTNVNMTLDAGKVSETSLGAFDAGVYTITAESDVPILVAARASRYSETAGSAARVDFAWFAAAPALERRALIAVGDGPSPGLHLANPTSHDATVTVKQTSTSTGKPAAADNRLTIPAGAAVAMSARNGVSYALSGFDRLMASVSYGTADELAAFTVTPTGPASQPITVYRR
ncbi:DUF5719 family protein [Parafrigoribacterium soli]|uniref:DUF5719 family protein n=1 Tax=Parafrigoribacterium soli TaxID=3144663 RepID=UPI0032EEB523